MQNILLIILSLSASLTHSLPTSGNNFNTQEKKLSNNRNNPNVLVNPWKITKGAIGLWLGGKSFFGCSKGFIMALGLPKEVFLNFGSLPEALSPFETLMGNRISWLTLAGSLTIFSGWVIKKSAENLCQGMYSTQENLEWLN